MSEPFSLPLLEPPSFCQFESGECTQDFSEIGSSKAFFAYASSPSEIAGAIESSVELLRQALPNEQWTTWRDIQNSGRPLICEICKAIRGANVVVADVTTLNFNVMFEIGLAIGLGVPVIPIRSSSRLTDANEFKELGFFETIGRIDFANSEDLKNRLSKEISNAAPFNTPKKTHLDSPAYLLPGPGPTEGGRQLQMIVKKSTVRFRMFDPEETPTLSLAAARKEASASLSVFAHLVAPDHRGAKVHNARAALVSGIAVAQNKIVVLLQEGDYEQPLDYREIVKPYKTVRQINGILMQPLRDTIDRLQRSHVTPITESPDALTRLDLGDRAAENEIRNLDTYFHRTGQFTRAMQGHARLVIGRKGSGKTAMYYQVRANVPKSRGSFVVDFRPEGHELRKLRDAVLMEVTPGQQEHLVTAFWNYILICELAHRILRFESRREIRDPNLLAQVDAIQAAFAEHRIEDVTDLSQRLLIQVDRIVERFEARATGLGLRDETTEILYSGDLRELVDAVRSYLERKESVWLLMDNLDKTWTTGGDDLDILILRGLLDATRKLEKQLGDDEIDFKCLVFLRTDIYEHLYKATVDKGKDTPIRLDWDDRTAFREVIAKRIRASTGLDGTFENIWLSLFTPHVGNQDSFDYIVDRTLMRPRDLIMFVQSCVDVALTRGHAIVEEADIQQAERSYSEEMLLMLAFELGDVDSAFTDILYEFHGQSTELRKAKILELLEKHAASQEDAEALWESLLWSGFLGVVDPTSGEPKYSYDHLYNLQHMKIGVDKSDPGLFVHPAFRPALAIPDPS